jgi:hypothetical protein
MITDWAVGVRVHSFSYTEVRTDEPKEAVIFLLLLTISGQNAKSFRTCYAHTPPYHSHRQRMIDNRWVWYHSFRGANIAYNYDDFPSSLPYNAPLLPTIKESKRTPPPTATTKEQECHRAIIILSFHNLSGDFNILGCMDCLIPSCHWKEQSTSIVTWLRFESKAVHNWSHHCHYYYY